MADKPGSLRNSQRVSRHTMVIRKAKEDDARRLAMQDEATVRAGGETRVLGARPAPSGEPEATTRESSIARRERTVSGRTVVIRREGEFVHVPGESTRLSGQRATSVRVTGGDTIIRYQSGDMVIKRGARRAQLRKQIIWVYALGYLILFSVYAYFLLTGTYAMTPHDFLEKAFSRRHGSDIIDLERAAFEAMRGNRTPAEVRLAETLSFYDENKELVQVAAGDRLTLLTAAKLAKVIIEDEEKPEDKRTFQKPFRLYHETYLSGVDWPYLLTVYNALGFFILLLLFLWRPLMGYLGTQGKKTAVALRNARAAQEEAAAYRNKYRDLAREIEGKSETMYVDAGARAEQEREAALADARLQAESIAGGIEAALVGEVRELKARLGAQAAVQACDQARKLLEDRLGQKEHDAAVDELIADISQMRFT